MQEFGEAPGCLITSQIDTAPKQAGKQCAPANTTKTWVHHQSKTPRAGHVRLNGETVGINEKFSNGASWPGDTRALSVDEVANCHCEVELTVPTNQGSQDSRPSDDVVFTGKRFGKKARKHCVDWGLDPASKEGRDALKGIIKDIIDNADDVSKGDWRGQPNPCTFYLKGADLVLVNADGEFASIMKGGASNARYRNAISSFGN